MAESQRILIADDHAMFRAGIRALLGSEPLLEVVGEVSTRDDAVDQARILKQHVVLMDLSMPGSSGLKATRRIAAAGPLPSHSACRRNPPTLEVSQDFRVEQG